RAVARAAEPAQDRRAAGITVRRLADRNRLGDGQGQPRSEAWEPDELLGQAAARRAARHRAEEFVAEPVHRVVGPPAGNANKLLIAPARELSVEEAADELLADL